MIIWILIIKIICDKINWKLNQNYFSFNVKSWGDFINQNASQNNIVFLYNGAETLGMIDEHSFKEWLVDLGIDEDVVYNATFYDKGFPKLKIF